MSISSKALIGLLAPFLLNSDDRDSNRPASTPSNAVPYFLNLEVESLPAQLAILAFVKSVQTSGPMSNVGLDFVEFLQQAHTKDLLAKVALVESSIQDRLVKVLQLSQRELVRKQLEKILPTTQNLTVDKLKELGF